MKLTSWILAISVAVLNILLNYMVKKTADGSSGRLIDLLSINFMYSFLVGTLSFIGLMLFYLTKVNLARGILLMGAASILGGTLFGVFGRSDRLDNIEWGIFAAIAVLYMYKFLNATITH